jgi:hypothetical protein
VSVSFILILNKQLIIYYCICRMTEMQNRLEMALHDVHTLREHNSKQDIVMHSLVDDRDTWQRLYEQVKVEQQKGDNKTMVCCVCFD